ncbi:hypothetical protein [Actinopolymorpha singaporensis]|uniref:hypothetical protein n=1 Tax=Actinopolymorpha singaporensis TaxID=117157 RepID=UPI000B852BB2|nr:hypothetical protein [Actinopolymorpha singaporensis]
MSVRRPPAPTCCTGPLRADPQGTELLQSLDLPILRDAGFVRVVGTMPMSTLASFPGLGLDHASLTGLVTRLDRATG